MCVLPTTSAPHDSGSDALESDKHTLESSQANKTTIPISDDADLILDVHIPAEDKHILYQVSTGGLRGSSPYFRNLLDPEKFSEGAHVRSVQATLLERYPSLRDAHATELPHISVLGIGQLSRGARHQESMTTFLRIVLGIPSDEYQSSPSWLANLVVIADRFDCLEKIKEFVQTRHWVHGVFATKWLNSTYKEESIRQILLSGVLLDFPQWVTSCSARLVMHGSRRWNVAIEDDDDGEKALWWTLPSGLEEELMYRRESILDTINSIQSHFLKAYTSRQRQCKLGYDSSPQCDSFQLGEMIRFLTRVGTLHLQGIINECSDAVPYAERIDHLLDLLRQCPSYQINKHHSHCGLRTRLQPAVDMVQRYLESEAGVCGKCWNDREDRLAWSKHPRVERWACSPQKMLRRNRCEQHDKAREMFTALERDWEPQSSSTR
ncbi:MAG: hypothetical protein M1830_004253 [Pleopsidium flavum]|nr:MAG: hypothetical protein M1830_004253 [Pleopsidium flavum]